MKTFHGSRPRSALTRRRRARGSNSTSPGMEPARPLGPAGPVRPSCPEWQPALDESRGTSRTPADRAAGKLAPCPSSPAVVLVLFAGLVTADAGGTARRRRSSAGRYGAAGAAASDGTVPGGLDLGRTAASWPSPRPADNLSDADDDAYSNIYVRDLQTRTTTYVSRGDRRGRRRRVLGSARRSPPTVATWRSGRSADNLSDEDDDGVMRRLRARPPPARRSTRAGHRHSGPAGDGDSVRPVDLRRRSLRRVRLGREQPERPTTTTSSTSSSATGADATTDVFVSRATDGAPGDADSASPSISADGRFVAFDVRRHQPQPRRR